MTPQERLHEFLTDSMREAGHAPAVFFGQDRRRKEDQEAPVIVYAFEDSDTIMTDDGEAILEEVFTVLVSSRGDAAEIERAALTRQLLGDSHRSNEITITTEEADRDDELDMSFQALEVRLLPYDSDQSLVPRGQSLTYGAAADAITYNDQRIVW